MINQISNFFVWYYLVKVKAVAVGVGEKFTYSMNKSHTIDMVRNLSKPLYQDNSSFGKIVSLFIRFWWVGLGTVYSLLTTIPRVFWLSILIVLPLVPFIQLINLII